MSAVLRAHHALREAGLQPRAWSDEGEPGVHPVRVPNALNEVWRCGPYILRINPRPGATRLQREAVLLGELPPEVHAPTPIAADAAPWGEWMIALALPGIELSRAWTMLTLDQRERAITELGFALRALHEVPALGCGPAGNPDECPHPLPVDRLLRLIDLAADRPGADREVLAAATDRLRDSADALDAGSTTLVHGDLHLENVLTGPDGQLTGVLDFEWCRAGPPDLDLDVLLHSLADPALHVAGAGRELRRRDFDEVTGWLRVAYPALFSHPRLAERLWVYRLAYEVRALLATPGGASVALHHPAQRIRRLVDDRVDLGWFLAS